MYFVPLPNFGLNAIGIGGLYYLKPLGEIVPYIGITVSYWYNSYYYKTDGDAQVGGFILDSYQKLFRMNAMMGFQYALTTQISFTANISIRYTLQSSFQQNTPYEPYLPTNGGIAPSIYKNTTTTLDVFRSGIGLIVYLN